LLAGEHNVEESGGIKTESLTLEFAAYVVRIEGTSLSRLIAEIREMKVKSVRLLPEPTNPLNTKMTKPEVIVTQIAVVYRHDENRPLNSPDSLATS
jgi:hypothetical protein